MEESASSRPPVPMLSMPYAQYIDQPQTQRAPRHSPRLSSQASRTNYVEDDHHATRITANTLSAHNSRSSAPHYDLPPPPQTALDKVARAIYTLRFPIVFAAAAYGGVPLHQFCLKYAHYYTYRELNDLQGSGRAISYPLPPDTITMGDLTPPNPTADSDQSPIVGGWAAEANDNISAPVKATVAAVMWALGIPTLSQLKARQQAKNSEGGSSQIGNSGPTATDTIAESAGASSEDVVITSLPIGILVPAAAIIALLVARYLMMRPIPRDTATYTTDEGREEALIDTNYNAFGDSGLEKQRINESLQRLNEAEEDEYIREQKRRIRNTINEFDTAEKVIVNSSVAKVDADAIKTQRGGGGGGTPLSVAKVANRARPNDNDDEAGSYEAVNKPVVNYDPVSKPVVPSDKDTNTEIEALGTDRKLDLMEDRTTTVAKKPMNPTDSTSSAAQRRVILNSLSVEDKTGLVSDANTYASNTNFNSNTTTSVSNTYTTHISNTYTAHSATASTTITVGADRKASLAAAAISAVTSNVRSAQQEQKRTISPSSASMLAAVRRTSEMNKKRDDASTQGVTTTSAGSNTNQTPLEASNSSSAASALHHRHRVLVEEAVVMIALPVPSSVEDVMALLREAQKHKIRRVVIPDVHDHFRFISHDEPLGERGSIPATIRIPEGVEVEEVANVRQFCVASRDLVPSIAVHRNVSSPLVAQPAGSNTPLARSSVGGNDSSTSSPSGSALSLSRAASFYQGTSRYTGLQWFNHPFNAIYVFDSIAAEEAGEYDDGDQSASPLLPNFNGNGPLAWCDYHLFLDSSSSGSSPTGPAGQMQPLSSLINLILYHRSVKPPRRNEAAGEVTAPSRHSPLKRAKYVSSLAIHDD